MVPQAGGIADIFITMIFNDKIEDELKMVAYLRSLLPEFIYKKWDQIIRTFSSNQEPSRRKFFIEEFENGNTRILICIDATGIRVNIWDMACAIQWNISDYLVFATLLQRIGRAGHNKTLLTIAIVFIDFRYILPDDIANVKESLFHDYKTALESNNNMQTAKIISTFHENNFKIRKSRL